MSISQLHKTKLQFKFGSNEERPSDPMLEQIKQRAAETQSSHPFKAEVTQTPKKVETPSNLISKGKAAILTGLAMMGTAGSMEIGKVKPLETKLIASEKLAFESTPIIKDLESASKSINDLYGEKLPSQVKENGIDSVLDVYLDQNTEYKISMNKIQAKLGDTFEIVKVLDSSVSKRTFLRINKKTNKV